MQKKGFGFKSLPRFAQKGFKSIVESEKPFFTAPLFGAGNKILGQGKADDLYWKALKPLIKADVFLGSAAKKITPKGLQKALWENKVVFPTTRGEKLLSGGKSLPTGVEYSVPSITSPIKKVGPVAMGILGTMKAEELLKEKNKMNNEKPLIKAADLQKAAMMLSQLKNEKATLEKKAKATELLYKQAEMGQVQFPKTHSEYEEKVAELMSKNLDVVEEAIKMASSSEPDSLGGLHKKQITTGSPHSIFARSVIGN